MSDFTDNSLTLERKLSSKTSSEEFREHFTPPTFSKVFNWIEEKITSSAKKNPEFFYEIDYTEEFSKFAKHHDDAQMDQLFDQDDWQRHLQGYRKDSTLGRATAQGNLHIVISCKENRGTM